MAKRLYRSRNDKMITGVCAGVAEYFDIDPTLARLGFILLSFAGGSGILAYIIASIVIPEAPANQGYENDVYNENGEKVNVDPDQTQKKTKLIVGVGLIGLGGLMFMDNIFWWIDKGTIWALAIIAIGAFMLMSPGGLSKK